MKSTNNFAVRFILRPTNKNLPEAVIFARIIVDKKRVEISLNKSIDPGSWNGEKQCAFGSKELVNRINPYIDEVRFKLNDCYRQLKMQDTFITAQAIKSLFVGEEQVHNTLLSLMHYHSINSNMILKQGTLKNYSAMKNTSEGFSINATSAMMFCWRNSATSLLPSSTIPAFCRAA